MRRRRDRIDLTAAVALFIFLGVFVLIVWASVASAPQLTAGVCTDKTYDPPYTTTKVYTVGSGDSIRVRTQPYHHDASYQVQVTGTTEDGETRAEWWTVGAGMYDEIEIGDYLERLADDCITIKREATQ